MEPPRNLRETRPAAAGPLVRAAYSARHGADATDSSERLLTEGDVLTSAEVATILHVPQSTVEDWARRGVVPSRKRGKRRLFLRWEVLEWLITPDGP